MGQDVIGKLSVCGQRLQVWSKILLEIFKKSINAIQRELQAFRGKKDEISTYIECNNPLIVVVESVKNNLLIINN